MPSQAATALEGAEVLISAGPAGVCLIPKAAWAGRARLCAPWPTSTPCRRSASKASRSRTRASERDGAIVYGALGVGSLKMKIHKACIARLFERNDLVLDAETIADVARSSVVAAVVVGRLVVVRS